MRQTQNVWLPWMKLCIAGRVLNTLLITWHNMLIQILQANIFTIDGVHRHQMARVFVVALRPGLTL